MNASAASPAICGSPMIVAAPVLLSRLNDLMHRLETIRETDKTGLALDADIESARRAIEKAIGMDTLLVPCAACDRGDFSYGHADGCPASDRHSADPAMPVCRVCGGPMLPGKVIVPGRYGSEDFGGDAGDPGTTITEGPALTGPVACLKCERCGHSFIPKTESV